MNKTTLDLKKLKIKTKEYGHYAKFLQVEELISEIEHLRQRCNVAENACEKMHSLWVEAKEEIDGWQNDFIIANKKQKKYRIALEKITDPRLRDHKEPDAYTELGCVMNIANEALKEE